MSDAAKPTTNHDEIMAWADEKGAYPAQVKGTGIIRLDFPGFSGEETLEPITWDQFFEKLDESQLAMLLQDGTGSGRNSRFNKLVSRGGTDADATTSSQRTPRRQGGPSKAATRRTKAGGRAGRGSRTRTVAKRTTRKSSSNKRSPAKSRHR